jgi:hypothetical protein
MKLTKLLSIFFILSIAFSNNLFAQQDSVVLNNILSKTKRLSDEQPIEKVYVHFDKPYYAVADTIWFKAYLTIEQNIPSPLSKVVYLEVLNERDSLIQTIKLPVKNSVAYGNIPLNMVNYKQGNYYVRAYTLWMLNFSDGYFFSKNITLGEAIDKQLITNITYQNEANDKNIKTTVKIQFRDLNKKVYANKQVSWQVLSSFDEYSKGRGTTDQNGILTLVVTSKNGEPITKGEILTNINISDKEVANASFKLKQAINDADFQFFPEGGQFIGGIPNQIGFKALKSNGLGIDVKGIIIDDQNNEVTTFVSSNAGMGSFYLSPETGKTYRAKVTFKDGSTKTFEMPKPIAAGIGLQVTPSSQEFINVRMLANDAFYNSNKDKTFFITRPKPA